MSDRHPERLLESNYAAVLMAAVLSQVPFIVTSTAYPLFSPDLEKVFHVCPPALEIVLGLTAAGYAFGALAGGDIINRFSQRRLFLLLELILVVSSAVTAAAPNILVFAAGNILQGLSTGAQLIVALPPVIQRFPASKLPITVTVDNLGFFGAVTAGPLIGGIFAEVHLWRWYYACLGILGIGIFLLGFLSLPHQNPEQSDKPFDWKALLLALAGTNLLFYSSGALVGTGFLSPKFLLPAGIGAICLVALFATELRSQNPLAPVRPMLSTFPLLGTLIAMFAGSMFVTLLQLELRFLSGVQQQDPLTSGLAFWPAIPAVLIASALLGWLVGSRALPVLVFLGMLALIAAGILLSDIQRHTGALPVALSATLLGFGAGATVSPALWVASFSLPSEGVGQVFALLELVRSLTDYVLAPVLLKSTSVSSENPHPAASGVAEAAFYATLITASITALCAILYVLSGTGLPKPDLEAWLAKGKAAFNSPPLLAKVTGGLLSE